MASVLFCLSTLILRTKHPQSGDSALESAAMLDTQKEHLLAGVHFFLKRLILLLLLFSFINIINYCIQFRGHLLDTVLDWEQELPVRDLALAEYHSLYAQSCIPYFHFL